MNAARTLHAAIVIATLVGVLGFVRGQADTSAAASAPVQSVEASPSQNPTIAAAPDNG